LKKELNQIKIGFDAKRIFNNKTGLGNYSRFIIDSLLKYTTDSELYLFTPKISEEWEHLYKNEPRVKIVSPQTAISRTLSSAWRTFSISSEISKLNLDIYHGLSNELPLGIDSFKGKKVVTIHDLIFLRYPDYYSNIDRFIYTRKFRNACLDADSVIATSEQTAEDIHEYLGIEKDKIKVVYQNCNEVFSKEADNSLKKKIEEKYGLQNGFILSVGTIETRKNQLTIVEAFHRSGILDKKLVLVGKRTEYAELLDTYIAESKITNNVIFLENLPSDELPALYQMADAFIYASEFEGFGIPVIEAYRSNTPVILAYSSSLKELGNESSCYFETYDSAQLSFELKKVIFSNEYAESLRKNGNLLKARFDSNILIEKLLSVYGE